MERFIGVSDFVKRQTKESRFSYFNGSWEELIWLVFNNKDNMKEGYRDGVILVSVPPERFYTSMCKIDENSEFEYIYESRREGEESFARRRLKNGKKEPAKFVDVVLYRKDVLAENNENSVDALWEIISINASLVENTPMQPMTMARNMLEKVGGTKAEYSGQEFAEAIWFWKDYTMYGDE